MESVIDKMSNVCALWDHILKGVHIAFHCRGNYNSSTICNYTFYENVQNMKKVEVIV